MSITAPGGSRLDNTIYYASLFNQVVFSHFTDLQTIKKGAKIAPPINEYLKIRHLEPVSCCPAAFPININWHPG
jgi:hypothetical protein